MLVIPSSPMSSLAWLVSALLSGYFTCNRSGHGQVALLRSFTKIHGDRYFTLFCLERSPLYKSVGA